MAIESRNVEKVTTFKGQRSGLPIEAYGFDSASQAQNFVLKEGQLKRVTGGELYASIADTEIGGVSSLHRFKYLWAAQRGFSIFLETVENSAIFNSITSTLTSAKRLLSSQWRDRLFFVNGQDSVFYLEASNEEEFGLLGLDAPDAQTAIAAGWDSATITSANAGNVPNGDYYYLFTLFDELTNSESPAIGALSGQDGLYDLSPNGGNIGQLAISETVSGGPKAVRIVDMDVIVDAVASLVPRASHFIVYRGQTTPVNSLPGIDGTLFNTFFRVPLKNGGAQDGVTIVRISDFVIAGQDFVDNTETLAPVALPDNNSPPPTPARMLQTLEEYKDNASNGIVDDWTASDYSGFTQTRVFRDQLFGIGAYSPGFTINGNLAPDPSGVQLSGTIFNFDSILHGSEVYQPDYWPYLWEVGRGDGQKAVGLGVLGDTALLVFKEKSTYYLAGSSPSDYVLRILDTKKGCLSPGSVQETPFGVITLDSSGFVLFNKIALGEKISTQIQDVIDTILFQYSDTFYSWYDNNSHRYSCAVVVPGSQVPNLTFCLDLDSMEWTYTQSQEGLCRIADTNSLGEFVDLAGMADNGRLVSFANEEIATFQGAQVESIWTSGTLSFGDDQHKKKMRWLYLKVKSAGSWTVTIEVIPDFDEARKYTITVNYSSEQGTWFSSDAATDGALIWDEGVWAFDGPERFQAKIPILCKGRLFQVRLINRDTAANRWGFAIEGISAEAVMLGR